MANVDKIENLTCAQSARGASLVEYAALVTLIALIGLAGIQGIQVKNKKAFCSATNALDHDIEWSPEEGGVCVRWVEGVPELLY